MINKADADEFIKMFLSATTEEQLTFFNEMSQVFEKELKSKAEILEKEFAYIKEIYNSRFPK